MQKKQIINVGPAPLGPYSSAVSAGGFVYVSGMLAQDADGALIAGDVAAQTRHILERSRGVLASAGSSLDQAVAVTVYLRSAADFQAMNAAYRTFWEKDPPTRTTVITGLLLDADVEIAMVAATSGAGRRVIHPEGWVRSPNPYSYAIRSGETVFLSGLVPRNGRDNSTVTGDITVQTKAVMENAGELLRAADLDYDDIVSARVYLPDAAVFERMNAVYRWYFTSAPPARATVQAGLAGSGYAVEMTFVATSGTRETFGPGQNLSGAVRAGPAPLRLRCARTHRRERKQRRGPDTRGDVADPQNAGRRGVYGVRRGGQPRLPDRPVALSAR